MRTALTTIIILFCIVTHAAHIAPWNPGTGAETICAYDVRNWLARRTTADGADAFSYDMVGNLLSVTNLNFREAGVQDAVYQPIVDSGRDLE